MTGRGTTACKQALVVLGCRALGRVLAVRFRKKMPHSCHPANRAATEFVHAA